MEDDELARLIQSDTLDNIYMPESTGGLLFDREVVEFTSQRLGDARRLYADLSDTLAEMKASPIPGKERTARYNEQLQATSRVLVQLLANLTFFAVAEDFTSQARSDAARHLAEDFPEIAPLLPRDAQVQLRQLVSEASTSPGADPRLAALSSE